LKALITGITGFAGTHLAEHLLADRDDVLGVAWRIEQPASEMVRAEVAELAPDVIYHLAAISVPAQCGAAQPTPAALAINVDGTRHVVELAAQLRHPPRVLVVSSSHVYGPSTSPDERVNETATPAPRGGYGQSKLAAERAALTAAATSGVEVVIARAFNHTGPRQLPPLLVPEWCEQIARGQLPLAVKNETAWLDLSDVRDVVRAYRLLAEHGRAGEVYNVGSGEPRRSGDIARQLLDIAGARPEIVAAHNREEFNAIADIRKLQLETQWEPQIPLATTLRDAWNFWAKSA
jgi:GDP-4-dehydro-6-deoxy-D-mannose reductase